MSTWAKNKYADLLYALKPESFSLSWLFSIQNVLCLVDQSCLTLCNSMDCSLPGSSVHGDSPGKNTEVGRHSHLQGIFPTQGIKPRSPVWQVDSLPSEPPGKSQVNLILNLSGHIWFTATNSMVYKVMDERTTQSGTDIEISETV